MESPPHFRECHPRFLHSGRVCGRTLSKREQSYGHMLLQDSQVKLYGRSWKSLGILLWLRARPRLRTGP
jgi:hypothetical protein